MRNFTFGAWVYTVYDIEAENFEEAVTQYNDIICNTYSADIDESQYAWEHTSDGGEKEYLLCADGWYDEDNNLVCPHDPIRTIRM